MNDLSQAVYVVDDDEGLRRSTVRLLTVAGFRCVPFASAEDFLAQAMSADPGCLLLDLRMPVMDGLKLQNILGGAATSHPIVFLTANGDVSSSVAAMKAGAIDFLTKPAPPEVLLAAIERALDWERNTRSRRQELNSTKQRLTRLTPREHEVLHLVVRGLLNKQIAAELGTAEKTVKIHRSRVMEKMEVNSVAELVRLMERAGPFL